MRVSLNSDYGMLICTITHILTININMHVTSAPRRRTRGPASAATWHRVPRRIHVGPTRKENPFLLINFF